MNETREPRAIGWCVIVFEDRPQTRTVSGIELAQMSQLPPCTGHIASIGPRALKQYPELRAGMRIHFKPYGGKTFVWRTRTMRALRQEDVLAIVTQE